MRFACRHSERGKALGSVLLLATALACAEPDREAGPWPQWRGVEGRGISNETDLPVSWTEDDGIRWATELPGQGISSPIVGPGTVYLTADEGEGSERQLSLLALELDSGEIRWKAEILQRPEEKLHRLNRAAAATPATDGRAVYVYLGSHLAAVDLSGKVLWLREIDADYLEHSRYGTGSSLVLTEDDVIVFQDLELWEDGAGWIAAFDKKDGERRWITQWDNSCCSYTTPIKVDFAGETEIVVAHARKIISYSAKTGERIWQRDQTVNQPVASPVAEGDLLCAATGAHNVREMGCWRLLFKNDKRRVKALWKDNKMVPATASPLLYNGLFFTVHEKGFVGCYNPETGNRLWRTRLPQGPYHASPVAGDGKIYAINLAGGVSVFSATNSFELLGHGQLPEGEVVASPAIADGCLIVRTSGHLYCVEGGQPGAAMTPS
ncbi:MAG: PQQ-binding-like beta-propeller repeat protein [bacterium]|nr:PQQ-binding-like beta-propeller repeat protein [bacterium]